MQEIAEQLQTIVQLAQNMGLTAICLLGWQVAWNRFGGRFPARFADLIQGAAYGLVGILSMAAPTTIIPGLIFDMRMPLVALATLFVSPSAGLIVALLQGLVRLSIGGVGTSGAMYGLAVAFGISACFRLWHRRHDQPVGIASLVISGALIGAMSLGSVLFLPDSAMMIDIVERVAVPLVLVVPAALAGLGGMLRIVEYRRLLQHQLDESMRLFRIFYNRTPLMLIAADASGVVSAVSDQWLDVMGYQRGEVVGHSRWGFLMPESAERIRQELLPRIEAGETLSDIELQLRARDGRPITARVWMTSYVDPPTNTRRYLMAGIDMTAQFAAERDLAEKQRQFSAIMDTAPAAIYLKDRQGHYQLVNRCFEQWFSRTSEQIRGKTDQDFAPADVAETTRESDLEVLQLGRTVQYKRPAYGMNQSVEQLLMTKFPLKDDTGAIVGLCGFILDITELERMQRTAQERERDLNAIMDNAPTAIFLKDTQSRFVRVNRRWEEWIGRTQADIQGRSGREIFSGAPDRDGLASDRQVIESGMPIQLERPAQFNHRDIKRVSVTKFPVRGQDGEIVGVGGIVADITDRVRAEESLRANEARFRALVEYSNDIFVVIDRGGTMRYRSPTRAEGLGYGGDLAGSPLVDLIHPDDVQTYVDANRAILEAFGRTAKGVSRLRHKDGSWRWIDWSMRNALDIPGVEGIIVNFRDVTEARRIEEELQQAQKMEAIGRLAGGIAHDFNNILGAISGFSELALGELPNGSRVHGFVSRISTASDRAKDLVQQILSFSRRSPVERRPENLSKLVSETEPLLRAALPASTELELHIDAEQIVARVNVTQVNQILLNLCQNASHALGGKAGRVTVRLDRIDGVSAVPEYQVFEAVSGAAAAPTGNRAHVTVGSLDRRQSYARITVSDSGSGMSRDVLERIFDPFFTTKARGRGTGLGLAVVHGIIMSHGGACLVSSTIGEGTSFAVYLPTTTAAVAETSSAQDVASMRGAERIMVIDDEEDICDVLTEGLERLGYNVAAVSDPSMALEAFADAPDEWNIVISDQIMPHIRGLDLCARMKAIKPSLKFVLCTGYSDGTTEAKAFEAGVDKFFMKPVSVNQLAAAIRQTIDGTH